MILRDGIRGSTVVLTAAICLVLGAGGAAVGGALITGADVKNGSLTKDDIKQGTLTSGDVANGTLQAEDIKQDTLTSGDVKNSTLQAEDIKQDTLTSGDVKDGAVKSVDIKDGTVTLTDIDDATEQELSGVRVVTAPGGGWTPPPALSEFTPNGVVFGPFTNSAAEFGGVRYEGADVVGHRVRDIAELTYSAGFNGTSDEPPYLRILTDVNGDGFNFNDCCEPTLDDHEFLFSPAIPAGGFGRHRRPVDQVRDHRGPRGTTTHRSKPT